MKKLLAIIICSLVALPALADSLTVKVDVKSGEAESRVVGADIYTYVGDKLYEVTYQPEDISFKMNLKAGALRIKSFWATRKQLEGKKETPEVAPVEK